MADFIPRKDLDFQGYSRHFYRYAREHATRLGLPASLLDGLGRDVEHFDAALSIDGSTTTQSRLTTSAKNAARATLEAVVRDVARRVRADPACTPADRVGLGLTTRRPSEPARRRSGAPAHPARVRPTLLDAGRLKVILWQEPTTRPALPDDAAGALVFVAVTPADEGEPAWDGGTVDPRRLRDGRQRWAFERITTRPRIVMPVPAGVGPGAGVGDTLWVRACWFGPRGQAGPVGPAAYVNLWVGEGRAGDGYWNLSQPLGTYANPHATAKEAA